MPTEFADSSETLRLLDAASQSDGAAIDALFDRHLREVRKSIRRRMRPQVQARFDESDIVQETHQHARRRLKEFLQRRPMPFRLWLLRTAHERLVEYERMHLQTAMRSVNREFPLPDASSKNLAALVLTNRTNPVNDAVVREQARIIRRCLAQLPNGDRNVLLLRVFDNLSNADVAAVLSLKPETARKRFYRALVKLKQLLHEAGLRESPA